MGIHGSCVEDPRPSAGIGRSCRVGRVITRGNVFLTVGPAPLFTGAGGGWVVDGRGNDGGWGASLGLHIVIAGFTFSMTDNKLVLGITLVGVRRDPMVVVLGRVERSLLHFRLWRVRVRMGGMSREQNEFGKQHRESHPLLQLD